MMRVVIRIREIKYIDGSGVEEFLLIWLIFVALRRKFWTSFERSHPMDFAVGFEVASINPPTSRSSMSGGFVNATASSTLGNSGCVALMNSSKFSKLTEIEFVRRIPWELSVSKDLLRAASLASSGSCSTTVVLDEVSRYV